MEDSPNPVELPVFWEPPQNFFIEQFNQPWEKMMNVVFGNKFDMQFYVRIHKERQEREASLPYFIPKDKTIQMQEVKR